MFYIHTFDYICVSLYKLSEA